MPAAKPSSSRLSAARLPWRAMVVAIVLGLGLILLGADATAQTQGAPEVAAAVDPAETEATTQQPSLTGGSWSEMGLKGSISTTF